MPAQDPRSGYQVGRWGVRQPRGVNGHRKCPTLRAASRGQGFERDAVGLASAPCSARAASFRSNAGTGASVAPGFMVELLDRHATLVPFSCSEEVGREAHRIAAQQLQRAPAGPAVAPALPPSAPAPPGRPRGRISFAARSLAARLATGYSHGGGCLERRFRTLGPAVPGQVTRAWCAPVPSGRESIRRPCGMASQEALK